MSINERNFSLKITGLQAQNTQSFLDDVKQIKGVIFCEYDSETNLLTYIIDEWSSDYDVFTSINGICENYNADLDYDEVQNDGDEASEVDVEESQEVEKQTEVELEEIEEEDQAKTKKENYKFNLIEKAVELAVATILIVLANVFSFGQMPTLVLYVISFALIGYEVFYSLFAKLIKKDFLSEELLVSISTLVTLYLGHTLEACLIMLFYSIFLYFKMQVCDFILDKFQVNVKDYFTFNNSKIAKFYNKNQFIIRCVILGLGLVIAFIPPIFTNDYGYYLQTTYLYFGALILSLFAFSNTLVSLAINNLCVILGLREYKVKLLNNELIGKLNNVNEVVFADSGVISSNYKIVENTVKEDDIPYILALESNVNNLTSKVIKENLKSEKEYEVSDFEFINRKGLSGTVNGKKVVFGNLKFLQTNGINVEESLEDTISIYLAIDGKIKGYLVLEAIYEEDVQGATVEINEHLKIATNLFSSKNGKIVGKVKNECNLNKALAGANDSSRLKKLQENSLYVGDFVNDQEVFKGHKLYLSLNGQNENASCGCVVGKLRVVPRLLKACKRAIKIEKQNLIASVLSKIILSIVASVLIILNINFIWQLFLINFILELIFIGNSLRSLTYTM